MKEEPFIIKSYGKGQLAMIYFPDVSPETAANKFRDWLKVNPRLCHLVTKSIHDLTPAQVQLIVDEIGKPFRLEE